MRSSSALGVCLFRYELRLSKGQAVVVQRVGDGLEVRLTVNISTVETTALCCRSTGSHTYGVTS